MKSKIILYKTRKCIFSLVILMNISFFVGNAYANKDSISITIKSIGKIHLDSVQVDVWDHFTVGANQLAVSKSAPFENGSTRKLSFPLFKGHGIFLIRVFRGNIEDDSIYYPVTKGDQVSISIDSVLYSFSGKGAKKMQVAYELDALHDKFRAQYYDLHDPSSDSLHAKGNWPALTNVYFNKPLDSLLNEKLVLLERHKKQLLVEDYKWLKANTIIYDYFRRFSIFDKYRRFSFQTDSSTNEIFAGYYVKYLKPLHIDQTSNQVNLRTPWYVLLLTMRRPIASRFESGSSKEFKDIISYVNSLPEEVRESCITSYLLVVGINKLEDAFVEKALSFVKSEDYLELLTRLRNNVKVGGYAYNFTLDDPDGKKINLADFKGKVVFMDFWFTGCIWCKVYYANTLKAVEEHYKGSKDIVFLSICVDIDKKRWVQSIREGEYNGAGSINLYTSGLGLKHNIVKYYGITGYPTQVIVDREMKNYNVHNGIRTMSASELISYLDNIIKK